MLPSTLSNVEGWDVVSADAVRVGQVREAREGFLIVELVPTLRGAADLPGRPRLGEIRLGEVLPGEPPLPETTRLTDPDPTVAETEIYGHQSSGASKHAGAIPGAVPRSSPRDRDVDEEVGRLVRIPASQVRVVEGDGRVFLDSLRSQEVAGLPVVDIP
jgi:hypothetical protein